MTRSIAQTAESALANALVVPETTAITLAAAPPRPRRPPPKTSSPLCLRDVMMEGIMPTHEPPHLFSSTNVVAWLSGDLALFIPVAYCRLTLGDEPTLLRVPLAAATGMLSLVLFSWSGEGDFLACIVVLLTLGLTILRPRHLRVAWRTLCWLNLWRLGVLGAALAAAPMLARHLFPLSELALAYATAKRFAGAALEPAAARLALVSITAQLPLGFLGIHYLRVAQQRKNALLAVGNKVADPARDGEHAASSSRAFARHVLRFVALTALPYFAQRTVVETINAHATARFLDSVENAMRLRTVLASGAALGAAGAGADAQTIDAQAQHLRQCLSTAIGLLQRKMFSLPKLALLPGAMASHPLTSAAGLTLAALVDAAKAKLVATVTTHIEELNREARRLSSVRSRVEAHDTQHAALLRGARAEAFTRGHWSDLTLQLQAMHGRIAVLSGLRNWIRWLCNGPAIKLGTACRPHAR